MYIDDIIAFRQHSGFIVGCNDNIVTKNNKPSIQLVYLYDSVTLNIVFKSASNSNGSYMFLNVDPSKKYLLMVRDYNGNNQPYAWDEVVPSTNISIPNQELLWNQLKTGSDITYVPDKTYPLPLLERSITNHYYSASNALSSFIEGSLLESHNIKITCSDNIISTTVPHTYIVPNININDIIQIEYPGGRVEKFDLNYSMSKIKGYITGSVNSSCEGTNFKIRVYREDGFFIGDYDIAENGSYEIPNLNVHSSYDVLLYDLNLAVETQVNSRRIPTAYSVIE